MTAAIVAVIQDIGPDIDAFVQEEGAAHGDRGACMAGDTILAFCTFMHLLSGTKIDAWDVPSVQRCLIEHLAQNLLTPDDWLKNAVPILCRFLSRMEASGRITNASELIAALKQAERAYAQEDPITATGKPKRVLTPEQKAAAAERMAKARAARKLNLEKPSTSPVEQPQPTLVVEEVTE